MATWDETREHILTGYEVERDLGGVFFVWSDGVGTTNRYMLLVGKNSKGGVEGDYLTLEAILGPRHEVDLLCALQAAFSNFLGGAFCEDERICFRESRPLETLTRDGLAIGIGQLTGVMDSYHLLTTSLAD